MYDGLHLLTHEFILSCGFTSVRFVHGELAFSVKLPINLIQFVELGTLMCGFSLEKI